MKICLATLLFLSISLGFTNAEEKEKTCKQVLAEFTKRQLGGISTCTKSMKFKNGKDKSAKMNCILKCVLMKEDILGKDGFFDLATFEGLIQREFPAFLQDRARDLLKPCADENTKDLDPKEEFCKSYDPFIKCIMSKATALCA